MSLPKKLKELTGLEWKRSRIGSFYIAKHKKAFCFMLKDADDDGIHKAWAGLQLLPYINKIKGTSTQHRDPLKAVEAMWEGFHENVPEKV